MGDDRAGVSEELARELVRDELRYARDGMGYRVDAMVYNSPGLDSYDADRVRVMAQNMLDDLEALLPKVVARTKL